MIVPNCQDCGGTLRVDGDIARCEDCGWETAAQRVPELPQFEADWDLSAVRFDRARDEFRVTFDVSDKVDTHVVARCTTDCEFKAWEPHEPEVDADALEHKAVKAARCFDGVRWSQ